jgi:hypothetical protein
MNPFTRKTSDTSRSRRAPLTKAATAVEPSVESRRYQRRSARRIVPLARQSCTLKVAGKVLAASLVNESRGGFSVWTDSEEDLKIGEKVRLRTEQGLFTVRIVYVREVAKSDNAQSKHDSWFQLGLKKTGGLLCLLDSETVSSQGAAMVAETKKAGERSLRTKRKIEAAIAEEIRNIEQEHIGQEPKLDFCPFSDR